MVWKCSNCNRNVCSTRVYCDNCDTPLDIIDISQIEELYLVIVVVRVRNILIKMEKKHD